MTVSSEVFWAVGGILAAISQLQRLQATVCLVLVSEKVKISSSFGRFLRNEVFTESVFIQLGLLNRP